MSSGAESDERDVRSLPGGDGADVLNLDLAGDDLVAERGHDWNDELETIPALIGDQNAQVIRPVPERFHRPIVDPSV